MISCLTQYDVLSSLKYPMQESHFVTSQFRSSSSISAAARTPGCDLVPCASVPDRKTHVSRGDIYIPSTFGMFQTANFPQLFLSYIYKKKQNKQNSDTVFRSTPSVWINVLWHARVQRSEAGTDSGRKGNKRLQTSLLCHGGRPEVARVHHRLPQDQQLWTGPTAQLVYWHRLLRMSENKMWWEKQNMENLTEFYMHADTFFTFQSTL